MVLIANLSKLSLLKRDVEDINGLIVQLTDRPISYSNLELKRFLKQKRFYLMVAIGDDRRIVGMATLTIDDAKMLTQKYNKAKIGYVVVDESCRGRGIAQSLMGALIKIARQYNAVHVSLTSNPNNPNRVAAIRFYERLGFKKIGEINGSNYYRLDLK